MAKTLLPRKENYPAAHADNRGLTLADDRRDICFCRTVAWQTGAGQSLEALSVDVNMYVLYDVYFP